MSIIFPILYPLVTPFLAYHTFKYAAGVVIDKAVDKTKTFMWFMVTYPFTDSKEVCVKCECEKCKKNL